MIILVSPLQCDKIIYFLKILLISNIPYILIQSINQQDIYRQETVILPMIVMILVLRGYIKYKPNKRKETNSK